MALLVALLFFPQARLLAADSDDSISVAPTKDLPLPGEVFLTAGHTAFLIPATGNPAETAKPWVWYAPTLPGLPGREEQWMFDQFLASGIAVAGIDVGESYGSPTGRRLFTAFYEEMTGKGGYSTKPVLLGRSRGGLMALSWAAENPEKVGGFAGIYPVCNLVCYPGVAKAAGAYEMTAEQLQSHLTEHNPVDRLAALARAKVPLFSIHGDIDTLVPLEANSRLMQDRYNELGGSMQLIVAPGQGHNMWAGFFQSAELVDFVKAHAGPLIALSSPLDHQVIQRTSKRKGSINISGEFNGLTAKGFTIEGRLTVNGQPGKWRNLTVDRKLGTFLGKWDGPSGGWHRLEVRAVSKGIILAGSTVEHVGIGEVFVVAGQSNSANHGGEKQETKTGIVAAFDGKRWQLARDPQPGASGSGGSFMPPFGDAIAERFHVPVGIIACGVGASSVREWLPKGATFPNPPTLTGHVGQRPDGQWESNGELYAAFTNRMKQAGPRGFRAVLWHQGESDANQSDATRTLRGDLYRKYLEKLIHDSRRDIGWKAPWFVAQASYHVPGDEGSSDIRAAQAALWRDGIALEGPDTDAIKGLLRENEGKGVHFSGPGLREHAARWVEKVAAWLEKKVP